jgi:colicin import membrane protein
MTERRGDRALSILLSVLIHAAIVGALIWGWWRYRLPRSPPQTLAIEATVVRNAPAPAPSPPPSNPQPAVPDAAAAQQQAAEEAARQKALEEQRAAQQRAERQQREQAERAAAQAAEQQQAAAAEAARKAKADADRKAKEDADRKARAEADRKAQELAQQRKAQQERAQREADLHSQLEAEEHLDALQSSPAQAEYLSLITARINRKWKRPDSARAGVKCTVHITQVPGGEITHVSVTGCNGDEAVRQSVETAAYSASPLPAPSDPALFDPNIDVTFAPDE